MLLRKCDEVNCDSRSWLIASGIDAQVIKLQASLNSNKPQYGGCGPTPGEFADLKRKSRPPTRQNSGHWLKTKLRLKSKFECEVL